jgi:hypothetical protein
MGLGTDLNELLLELYGSAVAVKESVIRAKAVKELKEEGWVVWWPRKAAFASQDLFSIFDLVCQKPGRLASRWIQLTSSSNHAARRKKILAYLRETGLRFDAWVWSLNERTGLFRKEQITQEA